MLKNHSICKNLEVDAIHPGYGFLSENADFARRLVKENITLIGPSAEAMEMMGDKLKAKATVKAFDVPMVPGTDEKITDVEEASLLRKYRIPYFDKSCCWWWW